ncbi:hypothetical protein Bca4012_062895 [Brassica carinata]
MEKPAIVTDRAFSLLYLELDDVGGHEDEGHDRAMEQRHGIERCWTSDASRSKAQR